MDTISTSGPDTLGSMNSTETMGAQTECHSPPGLKWACLKVGAPLSDASPYTGVMLVIFIIIFALVKQYGFEKFLMQKKGLYRNTWNRISFRDQRSLVNHHLSLGVKLLILVIAIGPFLLVIVGHQFDYSPIKGSRIDIGDILFIVSNMYTGMYVFELCYRTGISPIAFVHHTGTATMAQYALVLSHDRRHKDGPSELILCLLWGLFDIVSEAIPHFTFILYRLFPTDHKFLLRWFNIATGVMLLSTALETAVILWIYIALFPLWRFELKVITPLFHAIFTVAQLWGARALWGLATRQRQLIEQEKGGVCLCLQKDVIKREAEGTLLTTADEGKTSATAGSEAQPRKSAGAGVDEVV